MAFGGLQSGKLQRLYLGQTAESTFGTVVTPTHVFNAESGLDIQGIVHDILSDRDHASGAEYMKVQYPHRKRAPMTIPLPLSPEAWGFVMGFGIGDDTKAGSASDITHAFTQPAMHALLPAFTVEYHANGATYDSDTDWLMAGNYIKSWSLSIPREGWPTITAITDGAGYLTAGSTQTESGLVAPSVLVPAPKCRVRIKAAGTEGQTEWGGTWTYATVAGTFANTISSDFDLTPYLDGITITGNNDPQGENAAGTSSGSGVVGARPYYGRREVKVEGKWLAGTDTKALDRAISNSTQLNNAEYTMLVEWVSDTSTGTSSIRSGGLVLPLLGLSGKPKKTTGLGVGMRDFALEAKSVRAGTDYGAIRAFLVNPGDVLWGQ